MPQFIHSSFRKDVAAQVQHSHFQHSPVHKTSNESQIDSNRAYKRARERDSNLKEGESIMNVSILTILQSKSVMCLVWRNVKTRTFRQNEIRH
jgi:hypothetical protein